MIDAYPLQWPEGRPRTESWKRERSRFTTTFAVARDELVKEVKRLTDTVRYGDPKMVISTNIALRRDGLPLANQRNPDDSGVAVYFERNKRQVCIACDRWATVAENMRAIAKTIEALRGIDRWASSSMLEAAFSGFSALPPPPQGQPARRHWSAVLGVQHHTPTDDVRAAYRRLASQHHPDRGGDAAKMADVNRAYQEFQKERGLA